MLLKSYKPVKIESKYQVPIPKGLLQPMITRENELSFEDDGILYQALEKLEGVSDVDYNGFIGNCIVLTLEDNQDTPRTWERINNIIKSRLFV